MSRFILKKKYFTTEHIWFEEDLDEIIRSDYKIIHGSSHQITNTDKYKTSVNKQETLITDLSLSEEELFSQLNKTVKNEINRSNREGVYTKFWNSNEIQKNEELLNSFSRMYQKMYEEKGMSGHHLNLNELKEYAIKGALLITTASIDDEIVVYHSYIHDNKHSRLLHSCSEFRVTDNAKKNAIGRANKYLHWNDFLYLRDRGIEKYDWGGIESFDNPNGIDKFKMSFGGYHKVYYNTLCVCSLRAKIYRRLKDIIRL